MEPATIAVLAITGVFLGFCVWIERHSRSQKRAPKSSESVDDRREVAQDSGADENGGATHEGKSHKRAPATSEAPPSPIEDQEKEVSNQRTLGLQLKG